MTRTATIGSADVLVEADTYYDGNSRATVRTSPWRAVIAASVGNAINWFDWSILGLDPDTIDALVSNGVLVIAGSAVSAARSGLSPIIAD